MNFLEKNKNKKELTFYDFSRSIPESIGGLKKLEKLKFDKASSIPQDIGTLENLRHLEIHSDSFETLPESIGNLSNLRMLTLNCPKLKKLPEIKTAWPHLTYISMTTSALEQIPASFHLCENLSSLYLKTGAAKCLDGLEAFALCKGLSISIEGLGLQQFPKGILQLEFIKELTLKLALKELPKNFGQMSSLERLSIYMDQLSSLPASIDQLKKVWELNLYTPKLKELPACMADMSVRALNIKSSVLSEFPPVVSKIRSLTSLSIGGSQIKHIPDHIADLTNLASIYFQKNAQLKVLPDSIGQLKQLKSLSIENNNLTALPDVFDQLPLLNYIQLEGNALSALPASFAQLKTPVSIHYGNNPFGSIDTILFEMHLDSVYYSTGYGHREDLKAYIDHCKKNGATSTHFPILGALFHAIVEQNSNPSEAHQVLDSYDFRALLSIYSMVQGKFRDFLIQTLVWRGSKKLGEQPIHQGILAIAGSINLKKTKVKAALKDSSISYSSKVTEETTIVILGNNIKDIEVIQTCTNPIFINEASLTTLIEQWSKPYLVEAAKSESGSFNQQVADLLLHRDANNVKIGLEMLDGGGVPKDLLAILFAIHKLHPDKKLAAKAKKFLLSKASDLLKERNKIRVSWRNRSTGNFLQHYDYWQIVHGTELEKNIWQICLGAYLWQNSSMSLSISFHEFPKDMLPELIEAYAKDYLHYESLGIRTKSQMLFLDQFYPYIKHCKELLLEINLLDQPLLAKGIGQLKKLEKLTLQYNYSSHEKSLDYSAPFELPIDIEKCKNLDWLLIDSNDGWPQLPLNIDKTNQIGTFRIMLNMENPVDANPLVHFKQMEHFIFRFTKVNINHLTSFMSQLPPSKKITFNYQHKKIRQHLSLWKKALPNYTISFQNSGDPSFSAVRNVTL